MNNPIVDNRIVKDQTFAVRLLNFMKLMRASGPAMEYEIESFESYAQSLLVYQCNTATSRDEIEYLKRVGVYDEYLKPLFVLDCGERVFELTGMIYSMMRRPQSGNEVVPINLESVESDWRTSSHRVFFRNKKDANQYFDNHIPKYSEEQVKKMLRKIQ